jgi:dimeric dUTPase (all-alpha-NTP-PPase superfamily)
MPTALSHPGLSGKHRNVHAARGTFHPSARTEVRWWDRGAYRGLAIGAGRLYSPRMQEPDQLRELFRMQKALNERIGVRTDGMSDEEKTKWLLNYCRAMSQEIAELTDSVPWKWWAKYQKFDEQNARVEVVDLFHFLISLAQVLGMSADDVFNAYMKKNEVNFKRQETGYAVKDEHDSKHI